MGMFNKKKTQVSSTTVALIQDVPNIAKDSVITSITSERDLASDLITNFANCMAVKANAFYAYGRDFYTYGLPSGTLAPGNPSKKLILDTLSEIHDTGIELIVSSLTTCQTDNFAHEFMQKNRGWDIVSNQVTKPPFTPVGTVTFTTSSAERDNRLIINYADDGDSSTHSETVTPVTDMRVGEYYYQVEYYLLTPTMDRIPGVKYWNYNAKSTAYPALILKAATPMGSPYMPVVPLRVHNVDVQADKTSAVYKTSKKLLEKLGVKLDEVNTAINSNPDIAEIDHALIVVGIDIQTSKQASLNYLHDHFRTLGETSRVGKKQYDQWLASSKTQVTGVATPPDNAIYVKDSVYNQEIHYNYIDTTVVTGNIGKVGVTLRANVILPDGVVTTTKENSKGNTTTSVAFTYNRSYVRYRRQLDSNTYIETVVYGLYHISHIYNGHDVETSLKDSMNPDETNFIVPVNYFVALDYSLEDRTALYMDAIQIVIMSYKVTKLKWYQTKLFAAIVMVIAVIVTIWSAGTLAESMMAAATLMDAALIGLQQIAIALLFDMGFDFIVDKVGAEWAMAFAAITMAYSYGASMNVPGLKGAPFADQMLAVTSALIDSITEQFSDDIAEIMKELEELAGKQEKLDEQLDEVNKEFDNDRSLDPFAIIKLEAEFNPYETPDEFYYRTTHSGNVGMVGIDIVHTYVEDMLRLPEYNIDLTL